MSAAITIKSWKEVSVEGTTFQFVQPDGDLHPYAWEVPMWWYNGDETVYTNCARVDVNDTTSVYIDGESPLMQITITWDGVDTVEFKDFRAINRILVCAKDNIGNINNGSSDEYSDVEFLRPNLYVVRYDNYVTPNIKVPLQADDKPVWVNGNTYGPVYTDPIPFITGTYTGGVEPITYEYRHKEQATDGGEWTTPTAFFPQTNTPEEKTITLDVKTKAQRIHIETKATDAEGTVVYNNGPYLELSNSVPVITQNPTADPFNIYETGQQLVGYAGDFTGGLPDATPRARWQWRVDKDTAFSGDSWTTNVTPGQKITSVPVPEGFAQVRFQYQIVEPSANSGDGPRNTNKTTRVEDVSPASPPATSWGSVILYADDEEYNYFIGAPIQIPVGQPIQVRVEWEGDATGTTLWSQRSGGSASFDDATIPNPIVTMLSPEMTTITVTLTDPSGQANPPSKSVSMSFWAFLPNRR